MEIIALGKSITITKIGRAIGRPSVVRLRTKLRTREPYLLRFVVRTSVRSPAAD
ncbi:MAG: hypothetical protein WBA89_20840 [Microcoleus sp.]